MSEGGRINLAGSNAGMRLIAQCGLLKRGDDERLREFMRAGYTEAALQCCAADERLAALQADRARHGPLQPRQVLALEKHHALVLMQATCSGAYLLCELKVEEDYPHRITEFSQRVMGEEAQSGQSPQTVWE